MLVRAAKSDQAEHGRFPRIRKPRLVSIRDLALPAVVRSGRQLETGVHFCSGRIVSRVLASSERAGRHAIGE